MSDAQENSSISSINGVIDRFEGTVAVVRFQDGQELRMPIKSLPDDIKEGGVLRLIISTTEDNEQERERTARAILNELLRKAE